jgi:rSAM/selenodomain-associated transferase 2
VDWGTDRVCAQTRALLRRHGVPFLELPALSDVDRPEDLAAVRGDPRFADVFSGMPQLSVIVPTLDESAALGATLRRAGEADGVEIIVADGGSRDATRGVASAAGAAVLVVPRGRAAQMNAGAAAARGRILLFLHADTLLPAGYADAVRGALDDPAVVAGAFRFRTDGSGAAMRIVEGLANFRSRVLRWPYGDQGLFMEKRVFGEMGGFPAYPVMEDFELVRRLRRRGAVVAVDAPALTSARRWRKLGVLRTTLLNQLIIFGYLLGVPPERLRGWYRGKCGPPE